MKKNQPSMKTISILINKTFKDNATVTMKQILDSLTEKYGKEKLHIEGSMQFSIDTDQLFGRLKGEGHIESVSPSRRQKKILKEWDGDESMNWDSGDDGRGGEYAILESVKWRSLKKKLPRFI